MLDPLFPIDRKIQIIRDFKPMEKLDGDGEETPLIASLWDLYRRIIGGMRSFLVLLDNHCFYDACVIAGQTLETCAVLGYIKDNDPVQQTEKYNKYSAQCMVARLIAQLSMDKSNFANDSHWNGYLFCLEKIFVPIGVSILKKNKNTDKTKPEQHKEIVQQLRCRTLGRAEKIALLKKSYERSDPEGYVRSFSKHLEYFDDGEFAQYYAKYCDFKHSNIFSPGIDPLGVDENTIDWALDILLGIVAYLETSGWKPIDKKLFFKK